MGSVGAERVWRLPPGGDFVGWDEAVEDYYYTKMTHDEKADRGMEERILYSEFSKKFDRDFGPLEPCECPVEYQTRKSYKTLADLISLNSDLLGVSWPQISMHGDSRRLAIPWMSRLTGFHKPQPSKGGMVLGQLDTGLQL